jgi:hypothetical protein
LVIIAHTSWQLSAVLFSNNKDGARRGRQQLYYGIKQTYI